MSTLHAHETDRSGIDALCKTVIQIQGFTGKKAVITCVVKQGMGHHDHSYELVILKHMIHETSHDATGKHVSLMIKQANTL